MIELIFKSSFDGKNHHHHLESLKDVHLAGAMTQDHMTSGKCRSNCLKVELLECSSELFLSQSVISLPYSI